MSERSRSSEQISQEDSESKDSSRSLLITREGETVIASSRMAAVLRLRLLPPKKMLPWLPLSNFIWVGRSWQILQLAHWPKWDQEQAWSIHLALEFKLADFWKGIFVKRTGRIGGYIGAEIIEAWVCLIPCFPIHLTVFYDSRALRHPD